MQEISPNTISKSLEGTVKNFFSTLEMKIRTVESNVLKKVETSSNLSNLKDIL